MQISVKLGVKWCARCLPKLIQTNIYIYIYVCVHVYVYIHVQMMWCMHMIVHIYIYISCYPIIGHEITGLSHGISCCGKPLPLRPRQKCDPLKHRSGWSRSFHCPGGAETDWSQQCQWSCPHLLLFEVVHMLFTLGHWKHLLNSHDWSCGTNAAKFVWMFKNYAILAVKLCPRKAYLQKAQRYGCMA